LTEPSRAEIVRAGDRARVLRAREGRRPFALWLLIAGPGILVMLGENDGPSMLSYATTGATYGVGFFVPFIVLTFVMAFVVQEAVLRIGIATHRGHAELIASRFGPAWGAFAVLDLFFGNLLTLVAEFIAIAAGAAYFGVATLPAVAAGAAIVIASMCTRRYFTWERVVMTLAAANLLFIPAALLAHPDPGAIARAIVTWQPLAGGVNKPFLMLVMANIGATVTPWMLFFQQSAVVDKGLTRADLGIARLETAAGAFVAAVIAIAALVAAAPLFAHHVETSSFAGGADFATALHPYIGSTGAAIFALGMIEAGLIAAMTISTSSAYSVGEVLRRGHSLNLPLSQGASFYGISIGSIAVAAAVVLIPHAPLLAMTLAVNVIATVLMGPALIFVLLLANARDLVGDLANSARANVAGGAIVAGITIVGAVYAVSLLLERH